MQNLDKIIIIDYGSQYTQLIARRIREMGIYTEIKSSLGTEKPKGIILSGSPDSVTPEVTFDFNTDIPILGICYGMQLMNVIYKGTVRHLGRGEYGRQKISLKKSPLFHESEETVWMSHGDSIETLAPCLKPIAHSHDGIIAAVQHKEKPHFGVQFHPEVLHTTNGTQLLQNFVSLCGCAKNWTITNQIENIKQEIRQKVGNKSVVSLVSGGVDSTVATLLCTESLGSERVFPLHIDTGLMRHNESKEVCQLLAMKNLIFIDASQQFIAALKGISQPEEKRRIIGELFIHILEQEMAKLDSQSFFCQGTLYTDLIESGKGCGKKAAVIKSHHNVNPPIVQKKREQGLIIEPNAHFFKDEIRHIAKQLQVPHNLAWRHPFPGPGLAIRILGEVTTEKLHTLRHADHIYLEEIQRANLYDTIWQAFAVLLPVQTVGVMGDQRTEGNVIALRAITSTDGMTADFYHFPTEVLARISSRITNEVPKINRVVYDITSKPPSTIEWE